MYNINASLGAPLNVNVDAFASEPVAIKKDIETSAESSDLNHPTYELIESDILSKDMFEFKPGKAIEPHEETEVSEYGSSEDDYWYSKGQGASAVDVITAYYGSGGIDTVDYSRADSGIGLSLKLAMGLVGEAAGNFYDSIENIVGSDFDDVIVGSNHLIGNTLDGGNGADILFGEGGNDVIRGGNGHDDIWGGTGIDLFEWTHYGGNFVGADRIHDFEAGELLRFRVDNPDIISVQTTETTFEGATGLLVEVIETYDNGHPPTVRYDVFLDDVTDAEFTPDHIEIF